MLKQTDAWCVAPRPEGGGTGRAQYDEWRQAAWSNEDTAVAYENWLFFDDPAPLSEDAPMAFAWRRHQDSDEVLWASSVEFEQINFLRFRASRVRAHAGPRKDVAGAYLLMQTCYRHAAELAALWAEGREVQRLWPETSQEQLEKSAQICLGFAHASVIHNCLPLDKQVGAWRALHTLLLRKPTLPDSEEPATLRVCGLGGTDDQLRAVQIGAGVLCLHSNAALHFASGKIESACACAKQAATLAREAFAAAESAFYFEPDLVPQQQQRYAEYEYVRTKVNAAVLDFHMNLCAAEVTLPEVSEPLEQVYKGLNSWV